jgi:Flp pilus assembly protein TadB
MKSKQKLDWLEKEKQKLTELQAMVNRASGISKSAKPKAKAAAKKQKPPVRAAQKKKVPTKLQKKAGVKKTVSAEKKVSLQEKFEKTAQEKAVDKAEEKKVSLQEKFEKKIAGEKAVDTAEEKKVSLQEKFEKTSEEKAVDKAVPLQAGVKTASQEDSKTLQGKFEAKGPQASAAETAQAIKETEKLKHKVEKKAKRSSYEQKKFFANFISKAGIEKSFDEINKTIMIATGITILVATFYLIIRFIFSQTFLMDAIMFLLITWVFGSIIVFLVIWLVFFVAVDMKIDKRKKEVELVFPDFLQLTAANINAGMPIDRALWFAIRPRFGILAKEMESVAKATMVGENLSKALLDFSDKYDSIIIKRSLNLLLEGLESGGEVGDLLVRVANNLRETEIMKKEMAASVTTYVIFILFATLGAAPFLFGLTTMLIVIMSSIISQISVGDSTSFGGVGGMMAGSGDAISITEYQIFAVVSICVSSIFAAIIISVIQKGNAKDSLKNIPVYIFFGILNYIIAFNLMNLLLGGFFN